MAYVRQHWLSSFVYLLTLALGIALLLTTTVHMPEQANAQVEAGPVEPEPVDPYLYTRVQKLRQELSLTTRDLAAMGCDEASATNVLTTLKTWCQTNKAILDQHHYQEIQIRAELRETIRQNNMGVAPSSMSSSLSDSHKELARLFEAEKAMMDMLVAQLEVTLNATQLDIWRIARENAGLPVQLRYVPGLTKQQKHKIRDRLTDRDSDDSFGDILAQELTWNQRQVLGAGSASKSLARDSVRKAEELVLPVPDILQPDLGLELQSTR